MGGDAISRRRRAMRRRRFGRWALALAILLFVLGCILALLGLGTTPSVDVQPPAPAQDVAAARAIVPALTGQDGRSAPAPLTLGGHQLAGIAGMARQAGGTKRLTLDIEGSGVVARASKPLPFGLWLNTSARLDGSSGTQPGLSCSAGRIALAGVPCRWIWAGMRQVIGWQGGELPPLDRLTRQLSAPDGRLRLRIDRAEATSQMAPQPSAPVDFALARETYCRLARAQRSRPAATLEALLRRSFLPGVMRWDAASNRATLVAIAVLVVGKPAFALLPGAEGIVADCPLPGDPILLKGSAGLARYWAYAAGMTASFGSQTARGPAWFGQLGGAPNEGVGPGFFDLAADRAGIDAAERALAPASAHDTAAEFSLVSEDELFPPSLLTAPPALRNVDFAVKNGGIDATRYAEAANWIDRKLAELR